jgi:uncharacterized membrane protein
MSEELNGELNNSPLDKDIEDNKAMAALGYLWILCLVPLLAKPKSKFAQFHARQAVVLFLISFATIVPIFGLFLFLVLVVVAVTALIKSYNGEWWKIPFVYDLSKKIKL